MTPGFRCAVAAEARDEPLAGTASTVRAFLLLENPGPWGEDALRDARLPDGLGDELSERAKASGVRVLLIRRPGRAEPRHGIRVFAAYAHHGDPWLEATELDDIHEVHDLDVEALGAGHPMGLTPRPDPLFAVCTHGRHDTCCAERGRPVAAGLAAVHRDLVWEVSHIGGDRYAGNLLVLPHGLYYGRLDAAAAVVLAGAHLDGRLDLEHLRGRSGLAMSLQAAEIALRRHLGEPRLDAVRFVSRTGSGHLADPDGHVTDAVFEADGASYAVGVVSRNSTTTHTLTCKAVRENPVPTHDVHEYPAAAMTSHDRDGEVVRDVLVPESAPEPRKRHGLPALAALVGAAHPGPAFAVTVLAGLLGGAVGLEGTTLWLLVAAVLAGQLSIGWSNDLIDVRRDGAVGRTDKPVADGRVSERTVRVACGLALAATVPLSLACGWLAGAIHLGCVAMGWAYNLGLKSTVWSWVPYAVAFGGLTVFVSLTAEPGVVPPLWLPAAGALLGVGAHLVNVLPDLEDDEATGVRGLPHRLGARASSALAAAVLVGSTVVIVVGAPSLAVPPVFALVLVGGLALVALLGRGRAPFWAAVAMALVDVLLLVGAR